MPLNISFIYVASYFHGQFSHVKLSDFEDDFMFVTFIFTRCPIPNMCPALIYKQSDIATKFNNNDNLKVLTISFDHAYDTPKILERKYQILKSNNDNWLFLSRYQHFEWYDVSFLTCIYENNSFIPNITWQ